MRYFLVLEILRPWYVCRKNYDFFNKYIEFLIRHIIFIIIIIYDLWSMILGFYRQVKRYQLFFGII